jgi:phosphopantothenoylcysteine synthetase/decarboxylase
VGFAVESEDALERARDKLALKNCDAIVVNDPQVMESPRTAIRLLDRSGTVCFEFQGLKEPAAQRIIEWIAAHLAS